MLGCSNLGKSEMIRCYAAIFKSRVLVTCSPLVASPEHDQNWSLVFVMIFENQNIAIANQSPRLCCSVVIARIEPELAILYAREENKKV